VATNHRQTPSSVGRLDPPPHEIAQKLAPKRPRLGLADIERQNLAAAGLVDPMDNDERLAANAAAVSGLLDLGVKPQIRITTPKGRVRNACTCSSRPMAIRETSESEIMRPSDSTNWSALRVKTPADVGLLDDVQ
jgi:hypothetical protein